MHKHQRAKLATLPLDKLRQYRRDVDALISELEQLPRRDIDIAVAHRGEPALIVKTLVIEETPDRKVQIERILCSAQRCERCPHGDFRYRYRRRKNGTWSVKFVGIAAFDIDTLEKLAQGIREPIATYELKKIDARGESE